MRGERLDKPGRFTRCYGCGSDNPRGLGLVFYKADGVVTAEFSPAPEHGGYGRVVHGGVTSTVIDEAFGWAIYGLLGKLGMTTRLEVEFHAPLLAGVKVTVEGSVVKDGEREALVAADVRGEDGALLARGTGTMRIVSRRAVERLGGLGKDWLLRDSGGEREAGT